MGAKIMIGIGRDNNIKQDFPNAVSLKDVFSLSENKLLICDVNSFFIWDIKDKKIINKIDQEEILESSEKITDFYLTKVRNSNDLFLYSGTVHNEMEHDQIVRLALYKGENKICQLPFILSQPTLLSQGSIAALYENNKTLVEYTPGSDTLITHKKFDEELHFFCPLKNNLFAFIDKKGLFYLYELTNGKFIEKNKKNGFNNLLSILDYDDNYFICSIYVDNKKSKLQKWNKDTFTCNQEIEVNEIINKIDTLQDSQAIVGCRQYKSTFNKLLYFINFENNIVNTIELDDNITDFLISPDKKIFALTQDKFLENNRVIRFDISQTTTPIYNTHCKSLYSPTVSTLFENNLEQNTRIESTDNNINNHTNIGKNIQKS
jgi:hypothetical protein